MTLQFGPILEQWRYLLGGAWLSLQIAVLAFALGMLIGLACASIQRFGPAWLGRIVRVYVTFATNTPQLVQIFFLFFALPQAGLTLSPYAAVLIGATFNAGAYLCEIQRAGFASVHRTEIEAAEVLGFSSLQIVQYVIFPHVVKVMFPPLSNQFIMMTLGTSMASVFGVEELTGRTYNLSSQTYLSVEAFTVAAGVYIAITMLATFALAMFGRHVCRARVKVF
ncbi:amino acid ABC transporter permease [Paraburkholderia silvatlantica]|uniref:Amino acid ABC transporter membrane protein 1 (PAAT family) n=1 Tax=Paraburkholderia silvatlantica TaxID=321895 RepID=A0A2U1A6G2_9BURK|nr:amino acid ABC transporter permease [Paraburkholderia silvatlantica]MBB2927983.1 polar amino acid transport system permease protein [Paraburkholderia silvatlantica]PVY27455.1 amino acid ABC transporter membrane protein 1 (PAAT family) [Paraburkholderia silvatlantica]PXW34428.1 amino acid ABC transporter membrane protein 1 (PAAT family) [Paraburkholderia silvatlantica]PYE15721.1 amino acid ABC transporter membrane protein 1 (PAAT family) [Paraburkholderia silvatlantica]